MANPLLAKPIIERADNLLDNPTLRLTGTGLRDWHSTFEGCDTNCFESSQAGTVLKPTRAGHVEIMQEMRTYPNRRYRLDVRAEVASGRGGTGVAGRIQPGFVALKAGREIRVCEPAAMQVGAGILPIHRTYFQCPEGAGRLRLHLRLSARRPIVIKQVRLIECGDYMPQGHPLAVPPEPWREPPPYLPEDVLLWDSRRDNRPLLVWLRRVFSHKTVRRVTAKQAASLAGIPRAGKPIAPRSPQAEPFQASRSAIVLDLPAEQAPSLKELLTLSDQTIVIASLTTFAGAAQRSGIRGIRLQDRISGTDMPAATITFAGYHTRGFALADEIPYCWNNGQDDFAQRYLVVSKVTKKQIADMGLEVSLTSDTGQPATSHHPVAFYRRGTHGALVVMDPDGLEAASAGQDIPRVFDHLWRSALGRDTTTLGAFSTPEAGYRGVMTGAVEVAKHFDMIEDLSTAVRLHRRGNPPPMWLWPSRRVHRTTGRKTLLIRTGYSAADWPAIYGLIVWLKAIATKLRTDEPATNRLCEKLRVLALPITEPQNWNDCPENVTAPQPDLEPANLAGLIDLAVGDESHTVMLVPDKTRAGILQRCLGLAWQPETEIVIAPQAFADEPLSRQAQTDRLVCKIVLPGIPQPEHATSPASTDLAACLLERLAYSAIGWIVPNRNWRPIRLTLPTARRKEKIVQIGPTGDDTRVTQRRSGFTLPPGATLLGVTD